MKAIHFSAGTWELREVPPPRPAAGETAVRVRYVGICRTDLELLRGYMDFSGIAGHEWVGCTTDGRPVTADINFGCGTCDRCRRGDPRHCSQRRVFGIAGTPGALAETTVVPDHALIPLPDTIPPLQAVFLEPLAAALEILEQVAVPPQAEILLIGLGKLGQMVADVLLRRGYRLYFVGRHPRHTSLVRRKGGVELGARGKKFSWVVEASGTPQGLREALDRLEPEGTLILKSTYAGAVPLELWRLVVDEFTVVGSRCGRIENALRFWREHAPDYGELIDGVYRLEEFAAALAAATAPAALKVVVENP